MRFDIVDKLVIAALAAVTCLVVAAAISKCGQEERFMRECQADHKRYECEAMWRNGEQKTLPVFIPVSVGGR